MITTVLFDLDGTLLPMDQDAYIKAYFKGIATKAALYGYEPSALIDTIWKGTSAMIRNDGTKTNEAVFWRVFANTYGEQALKDAAIFDDYYANEFQAVQKVCGYNPLVPKLIQALKEKGVRIALATNPVFPRAATASRIRWAGLSPDDFALYTTYENSRYCKPNLDYYREILRTLKVPAESCIMVGNDVAEDMIAAKLGMATFLLTDCLIDRHGADLSQYPSGDVKALSAYLLDLLK